jgi:hypothetical protein
VYSLTSIPTLCYDLVRSPTGLAWGAILERALRLEPADLAALDRLGDRGDAAHERAWDEVAALSAPQRRLSAVMPQVRAALNSAELDPPRVQEMLTTLQTTPLGGLGDLLAMLRGDILDWAWDRGADGLAVQRHSAGADVVSDALAAAYLGAELTEESRTRLSGPLHGWLTAQSAVEGLWPPPLPKGPTLGPASERLRALVDDVATLTSADLDRLAVHCDAARSMGPSWPMDMHLAAKAALDTGMIRTVAVVQLAAVRALLTATAPAAPIALRVLPAITGAIACLAVFGTLESEASGRLLAPWVASTSGS